MKPSPLYHKNAKGMRKEKSCNKGNMREITDEEKKEAIKYAVRKGDGMDRNEFLEAVKNYFTDNQFQGFKRWIEEDYPTNQQFKIEPHPDCIKFKTSDDQLLGICRNDR